MKTKLTRIDEGVALVLDKPLLDELGLDENSEVELATDGDVLVMTPWRDGARRKLNQILDELDEQYDGVFRQLL